MKDIALRLNMSISTVSKALNDDSSISLATKLRVKKQAEEWNYIPNEAARHFKMSRTSTLGLIIPNMLDQFYALAINGVEGVASKENYNVIISQSQEDPANELKIIDLMKRNRVDGLLVAITKSTQDMSPFKKLDDIGIPVVFFSRPPLDQSFDCVMVDNEGGAYKATEFLIKKGHKRIGHLMGPESLALSFIRLEGYKKALAKYKLDFEEDLVKMVDLTSEATLSAMAYFMKMKNRPTSIFSFKNYMSLDSMEFLKREFPNDSRGMDFTGFGNLPLFKYLDQKPAASIEESSYEMGEEAAKLLFKIIKEASDDAVERTPQHIQIPCNLVVHNS